MNVAVARETSLAIASVTATGTKDPGNEAIVNLIVRRAPELRARDVTLRIYGGIALAQFSRCALLSTAYIRVLTCTLRMCDAVTSPPARVFARIHTRPPICMYKSESV